MRSFLRLLRWLFLDPIREVVQAAAAIVAVAYLLSVCFFALDRARLDEEQKARDLAAKRRSA